MSPKGAKFETDPLHFESGPLNVIEFDCRFLFSLFFSPPVPARWLLHHSFSIEAEMKRSPYQFSSSLRPVRSVSKSCGKAQWCTYTLQHMPGQ